MTQQTYWDVEGGVRLEGDVLVRGGKNSAPKLIVASLLTDEPSIISNVPHVGDVTWTLDVCRSLGSEVQWMDDHTLRIQTPRFTSSDLPSIYGGSSRLPILLLGPLLARTGEARVPHGGGCEIGSRPVDFHMQGLRKLGAELVTTDGCVAAHAKRLRGGVFNLEYPSVGATETLLLGAVLSEGTTILNGVAVEPEVVDLMMVLQRMGAQIRFESDRTIRVQGVDKLHGYTHRCVPDRNECVSWASAAIATDGDVTVRGADQAVLVSFLDRIREIGGGYEVLPDGMRFFREEERLMGTSVDTNYHPGFMSDWQPPFAALLTQTHGRSIIHETVYEDRFKYVEGLCEMGAQISLRTECLGAERCRHSGKEYDHSCVIDGPSSLRATELTMPDLRGGFAYIMAAMLADGNTRLFGVDHIARGYADFHEKLAGLGVNLTEGEIAADAAPPVDMQSEA